MLSSFLPVSGYLKDNIVYDDILSSISSCILAAPPGNLVDFEDNMVLRIMFVIFN